MFAQENNGARCLQDYKSLKAGAWVPKSNELYSEVKEWLESNDWGSLPDDLDEITMASEERYERDMDALSDQYDADMAVLADRFNLVRARDGLSEDSNVEAVRTEMALRDAQYESDQFEIMIKYA